MPSISVLRILTMVILLKLPTGGFYTIAQSLPSAQSIGEIPVPIEQISINEGLSQGMVNAFVQDKNGYLWIGTKDGLNRYDGTGFKVYRHKPNDSLSLADNFISSLLIDAEGNLWIGTQSSGLDLFNPETESFVHFRADNASLTSNFIGILLSDPIGGILVQTSDSLGFNHIIRRSDAAPYKLSSYKITPISESIPALTKVNGNEIWNKNIGFSKDGTLWYYMKDTIYSIFNPFDGENAVVLSHPHMTRDLKVVIDGTEVFYDYTGENVYAINQANTLKRFNFKKKLFEPFLSLPADYTFSHGKFMDSDNRLWLITDKYQLVRLDLNTATYSDLRLGWGKFDDYSSIYYGGEVLEDNYRNLWFATGGNGLLKISEAACRFKRPAQSELTLDLGVYLYRYSLPGNKAIYDNKLHRSWKNLKYNLLSDRNEYIFGLIQTQLTIDNDGNFWIFGVESKNNREQLLKVDTSTGKVDVTFDKVSANNIWIGSPLFSDQYGDIWFSEKVSEGSTLLNHKEIGTGKLTSYQFPITTRKFQYRFISDWYEDTKRNYFWFATTHGLFGFDIKQGKWETFVRNNNDTTGISSNMLLSICPDPMQPDEILWIGTEGAGLNKFNLKTEKFEHYTTESGLPNDVIYSIQSDNRKNLWIGTNTGLCLFNPKEETFRNFTTEDGLPGNEFNRYQFSKSEDGELYLGGTNGVVYFNPEDFYDVSEPSKVIINKLLLFNSEVLFSERNRDATLSFNLPKPIEKCSSLTFGPEHDMITFGFAVMDLTAPNKNKFKYRLLGLQHEWVNGGTRNEATFTNLSPGNYTLEVLGCNSSNIWSQEPTRLQITILPPWHGTWWFRILVILIISFLLYSIYRYRLRQLLKVEKMRNQIAQDLHDEIGSTLSSISLYSAVMQRSSNTFSDNLNEILSKIIDSTSEMMEGMNDIVWTIKVDNDSFEQVIYRMRAFGGRMSETKGVQFQFDTDPKAERLELGMTLRKNIYLIFKETVNNAIKYSNCKNLIVTIFYSNNLLTLKIKDDGIGFKTDDYDKNSELLGGNGIKGMQMRAREIKAKLSIESQPEQGCIITLTLNI